MSLVLIRRALEERLRDLSPVLATAWENDVFTPVLGDAHQRVFLLPSESQSPTFGSATELVRESGILQVSLYYPIGEGISDAASRAELIRSWFPKGLTLSAGGISVTVSKRASVAPANRDGEWHVLPVSIPYFSNIFV